MDFEAPDVYGEDDTPRRFKDALSLPARMKEHIQKMKSKIQTTPKVQDEWTVRPGESFREFNARIKGAGLTVPPGVPETFRGNPPAVLGNNKSEVRKDQKASERVEKRTIKEDPLTKDEKTKQKKKEKKEILKNKKKAKLEVASDTKYDEYERKGLRDIVKAPPKIMVKPKATLKSTMKKPSAHKVVPLSLSKRNK